MAYTELKHAVKGITKDVDSFEMSGTQFTRDFKLQKFLEKMFDTEFERVFINKPVQHTRVDINVGCRDIVILKKCGRILRLTNSEWGYFEYIK